MKIIVLKGGANSGKTSTMRLVHAMLCVGKDYWKNLTDLKNGDKDFECVFDYEGRKVAIYSMGDYEEGVEDAISRFETEGCDILICTSRYGKMINALNGKGFKNHETAYIDKTKNPHFVRLANLHDAQKVIQRLDDVVFGIQRGERTEIRKGGSICG